MDEKKIKEMAKDACSPKCHRGLLGFCEPTKGCVVWSACENAVREGYRKESDTAREILDEVSKHFGGKWLVDLYKKYGLDWDKEIE